MYICCAVCRVCRHTHCHHEHTLRMGEKNTVVLEASDSIVVKSNPHTHVHTHCTEPWGNSLTYSHCVACQMAPDIRQRLGIKLSEGLLLKPPPLLFLLIHHSLGIINFIIIVIIIVKLFFIFRLFSPVSPAPRLPRIPSVC